MKNNLLLTVKELFTFFKRDKIILFLAIFLSFLNSICLITGAIFSGSIIEKFLSTSGALDTNKQLYEMLISLSLLAGIYIIYFSSFMTISHIVIKSSHQVGSRIREKVFLKIINSPIKFIDSQNIGDLMSRSTNDIDLMIVNLATSLSNIFTSPFIIIGIFSSLFIVSSYLTLIYILLLAVLLFGSFIIAKKSHPFFKSQQRNIGELNATIEELIHNKKIIYQFDQNELANNHFAKANDKLKKSNISAEKYANMIWPWVEACENVIYGVLFIIGILLVNAGVGTGGIVNGSNLFSGKVNIGILVTFILLARQASGEIGNISRLTSTFEKAISCAGRSIELLKQPDDIDEGKIELKQIKGAVEFKHVSFGYNPDNLVIRDFNLKIKSGQKIAIVGKTGCGKSTLINLLMRFYEIQDGEILIDGIDIREISKKSLWKYISIVLQDPHLFSETIETNLKYGNEKANEQQLEQATKIMNIHHYIESLPKKFETVLQSGNQMSTGQNQLLTLARTYLAPSNILILDEATSSIDTKTEIDVQKGMIELMTNKTSFIIAHRLSTIINSDVIVLMDDGKILEIGSHETLLKNKKEYYRLYNSIESNEDLDEIES